MKIQEMQKVAPESFDSGTSLKSEHKKIDRSVLISAIGAFFVVATIGYLMSSSNRPVVSQDVEVRNKAEWFEESFAYRSGDFVTSQVRAGYIGR